MRLAEGGFDFGGSISAGKDEAEVGPTFRERNKLLSEMRRDGNLLDA